MVTSEGLRCLIAIPSPRDLDVVKDGIDSIKTDRLWIKYHTEAEAYKIIEGYFRDHQDEYDYLCIVPDDLIVRQQDYDRLIQTIQDNGGPEKIPTISGICNCNNVPGMRTIMAISMTEPIHPIQWIDLRDPEWREKGYDNMDLLPVKFSAFALQFIRKDIVLEIGLQPERDDEGNMMTPDVKFCYFCNKHQPEPIPIYVNPQVKLLHLRGSHPSEQRGIAMLVGKKKPEVYFCCQEGKQKSLTKETQKYLPEMAVAVASVAAAPSSPIAPSPSPTKTKSKPCCR